MRGFLRTLAVATLLAVSLVEVAPAQDPARLTLERIFASREFRSEFFGPARWLSDGSGYTTVEWSSDRRGREIVRYEPQSGQRQVLVPVARLVPEGETDPLWIEDYEWSSDGEKLLIFTNSQRVWRDNTRGDYWVLELASGELRKLGRGFEPSTLMFAKFSADGGRVAYVQRSNIYVEDLESAQITALTENGSETLINGTSDWVNEEEFFLRDGFRWSPDGRQIAYWQFDVEGVHEFKLVNYTDSLYPIISSFPYPKAGTTNSAIRLGIVSSTGGPTRWLQFDGDPRNHYVPRMDWAASSDAVVIQRMNRLQNINRVMLGDARTGKLRTVLTETDDAWLDAVDDLHWLDGGESFTWVSERDGWRHIYVVSRLGAKVELATPGDYDVVSVERIDEKEGWLYFIASPENPTKRYLYRQRLNGKGTPQRLTPADQPGTHSYDLSPDARWAFHTYSRFGVPPLVELVQLPEHQPLRTLVDNAELRERVEALEKLPVEFFRVDIGGGVQLDGWMMKPPGFDESKKYPLLFYVYGEPWGQTGRDAWMGSRYLWHLMLTQLGYIVVTVDNRGTPSPRGRAWRKAIYEQIGVLNSGDQAAAAKKIRAWPYVDESRIGIWGWSGGGSSSLNAIFRYPDVYQTAMAVAPVPDIRLYDTIYQERYTGLPEGSGDAYERGSPVTYAQQLEGNLLIVHGTGDDNVHYQGTEALINALVAAGKQFTVMPYPNRSHGIWEGRGTTLHLYTLLTRYLIEHLPPGPLARESE